MASIAGMLVSTTLDESGACCCGDTFKSFASSLSNNRNVWLVDSFPRLASFVQSRHLRQHKLTWGIYLVVVYAVSLGRSCRLSTQGWYTDDIASESRIRSLIAINICLEPSTPTRWRMIYGLRYHFIIGLLFPGTDILSLQDLTPFMVNLRRVRNSSFTILWRTRVKRTYVCWRDPCNYGSICASLCSLNQFRHLTVYQKASYSKSKWGCLQIPFILEWKSVRWDRFCYFPHLLPIIYTACLICICQTVVGYTIGRGGWLSNIWRTIHSLTACAWPAIICSRTWRLALIKIDTLRYYIHTVVCSVSFIL